MKELHDVTVVEWAPFTLRAGVEETRLLQASRALQAEFLDKQAGFLRRELLRGTQGQWFDLVYWASRSAAEEAIRNAASNHAEPGAGVLQLDRVAVFGS